MEDRKRIIKLYDFYGKLLTDRKKEIFEMYYYEDFSMYEIAETEKITAQAVKDHLKTAIQLLEEYEEKLSFIVKMDNVKDFLNNAIKEFE